MIDLFFEAEQIDGDLRAYFQLSARPELGEDYIPLSGHWPDLLPPEEPAQESAIPLEP